MKTRFLVLLFVVFVVLAMTACEGMNEPIFGSDVPTPSPTADLTQLPTATPNWEATALALRKQLTAMPTAQPTPEPTASPTPTATPTVAATVTPEPVASSTVSQTATVTPILGSTSAQTTILSGTAPGGASWKVVGVPNNVAPWKVFYKGDKFGTTETLDGWPSTGFGEPGVRTTEDCVEADNDPSAYCSLRTNVQETIRYEPPASFELPEGSEMGPGHLFFSGGYFKVVMPDGVTIEMQTPEDVAAHLWITGPADADGFTPRDGNHTVVAVDYDPGFFMGTVLPPGQRISLDYRLQNTMAAIETECGNDGCLKGVLEIHYNMNDQTITIIFFDGDGNATLLFRNWTP